MFEVDVKNMMKEKMEHELASLLGVYHLYH